MASAALNYFGKALNELTVAEMAYLAALPKGPNNYHPVRRTRAARARRNWVLLRMREEGYITETQRRAAAAEPIYPPPGRHRPDKRWAYFSEDIRRSLKKLFGDQTIYRGGLTVHSTLDTKMQKAAYAALRTGLSVYDRRHGWRGPIRQLPPTSHWPSILSKMNPPRDIDPWRLAVVLEVRADGVKIGLTPRKTKHRRSTLLKTQAGFVPLSEMLWAREQYADNTLGPKIKHPKQVLEAGDVIYVEPLIERPRPDPMAGVNLYSLAAIAADQWRDFGDGSA